MGFIIHVDVLGWVMREAQLPSRLSPICKSKQWVDQALQVLLWEWLRAVGMAREIPGAQAWPTESLHDRHRAFHVSGFRLLGD